MNKTLTKLSQANLWILLFFLPFGHLLRFELVPPIALYPHDILMNLFICLWLIKLVINRRKPYFWFIDFWPVVFAGIGLISWLLNIPQFGQDSLVGLAYWFRWTLFSVFYLSLLDSLRQKEISLPIPRLLGFVGISIAILGLLQYIFIPDTRFLYELGWDDHLNRLVSTLFDPGFTGLVLVLGLILELSYTKVRSWVAGLYLLTLALTFARSAYLVFLLVGFVWVLKTRKVKAGIALLLVFIFCVVLAPKKAGEGVNLARTQSIVSRQSSTLSALQVFWDNPIIGIGFNNYRLLLPSDSLYPSHTSSPDNSFLLIASTTGIVGLIIFICGLLYLLVWSYKTSLSLFLSAIAISIHSLTNNSWFYPFILIWLFFLMAYERSKYKELSMKLSFWKH